MSKPPPSRSLFENLLIALGREFRRRRMGGHLQALRSYYRRRHRRALAEALSEHRAWDENVVLEWLAILRIEPFDRVYAVCEREAPCPACVATRGHGGGEVDYCAVFPGGQLRQCRVCKHAWLVSDGTRDSTYVRGPGEVEEARGGRR